MQFVNPSGVAAPASNYSHVVVVPAGMRRAVVSGQIGIAPDGTVPRALEAQMEQAWRNVFAVLAGVGMSKRDIVKVVFYATVPDSVKLYREVRDRVLEGHAPACTYLEISALASPNLLCEIEVEAVAP